jgi:hypothetical protein
MIGSSGITAPRIEQDADLVIDPRRRGRIASEPSGALITRHRPFVA